jgi:hypothetical protein
VLLLASLLFVAALNLTPIYTSDFWVQLKVGDLIRASGGIPDTILFSFTEAREFPFVAHEWLASVISSQLYAVVGYPAMVAYKGLLCIGIFGLAAGLALQAGRSFALACGLGALCMLGINYRTHMRPEIYGYLCLLAQLNLLEAFRRTGRWVWLLPLLALGAVWANLHGSFALGLALPPLYAAGAIADAACDARRGQRGFDTRGVAREAVPLLAATAGMLLAALLNPYGWRLLEHVLLLSTSDYFKENIYEWLPVWDSHIRRAPYFWVLLAHALLVLGSVAVGARRLTPRLVLLLVVFGALALEATRYVAWWMLVSTSVLAYTLPRPRLSPRAARLATLGLAAVLVGASALVVRIGNVRGYPPGFEMWTPLPPDALHFLRDSGVKGNVFNSYNHGDQLVYHFYPAVRVAIDTRVDAYGEDYYRRYRSLSGRSARRLGEPEELMAFLDRYDVTWIVTRPFDYRNWTVKGHARVLAERGWREVYRDPATVILTAPGVPEADGSSRGLLAPGDHE